MLHIDQKLAARIELGEVHKSVLLAEQLKVDVGEPTVVHRIGSAVALNMGKMVYHPASRVLGLGFDVMDVIGALDEAEAFYKEFNLPIQVDFCPFADAKLGQELRERGYHSHYYVGVFVADLQEQGLREHVQQLLANQPAQIEVRKAMGDEIPELAQVAADGFGYPPGAEKFQSYVTFPDANGFVAYVNGGAAASGAFSVHNGAASFYLGATRPEYRGQGCQLALAAARLQAAYEMGCDLAVVQASPGSISHRNMERAGFRMAYTKMILTKEFA